MEPNNLIFVYGTLKRGEVNHSIIARERHQFLGLCKTAKPYHMRDYRGAFPVVFKEGEPVAPIIGEVYMVMEDTVRMLDRLENNGVMYQREFVDVIHPSRGFHLCEMYFGLPHHWTEILHQLRIPPLVEGKFLWT